MSIDVKPEIGAEGSENSCVGSLFLFPLDFLMVVNDRR